MSQQSLEQVLQGKNPVDLLRNSQIGAYVYPVVPTEFTNWRDEQRPGARSAVLFDQSHHMAELLVTGPDALKMLSYLAINSFANFPPNKAKQFAPCSYDGYVIGDVIMFYHAENEFNLVGRAPTVNWVQFHARDRRLQGRDRARRSLAVDPGGKAVMRQHYRFQVQGPNAAQVLEKLNGGPIPDVKFFNMDAINIKGRKVRALAARHGRRAGPRDLGTVRRARGDPRGDRRGGQGLRPGAGRRARVCDQHARVGLDSVAASGGLHRREDEEVPRVAAGQRLRSHRLDRRQLRLEQHRGLLRHAVRAGLRIVRQVRSRLHRPRSAREEVARSRIARR